MTISPVWAWLGFWRDFLSGRDFHYLYRFQSFPVYFGYHPSHRVAGVETAIGAAPTSASAWFSRVSAIGDRGRGPLQKTFLSRICGVILVPGAVPSCDKGQFP